MRSAATVIGVFVLIVTLWDTFEVMVLPRTVTRRIRIARLFYVAFWRIWKAVFGRLPVGSVRERYLGAFGPLSLLLLIVVWALLLILGFGLIQWGLGSQFSYLSHERESFGADLYMSGSSFFTFGLGDVTPITSRSRMLAVAEAGLGLGFLAVVISYLPTMYQAFSRREAGISRLDARAGSPPTAGEMLRRHARAGRMEDMIALLQDWENWCSDVLESHLSFPVLAYYRSQHDRESWLAALGSIIDVCALIDIGFAGDPPWQQRLRWQANMTFAMARHTLVDLALVLVRDAPLPPANRLDDEGFQRLRSDLAVTGLVLSDNVEAEARLTEARNRYEPYLIALSERLLAPLPGWAPETVTADNWQVSAWDRHF